MKKFFKWVLIIGLCWWAFKEDGLLSWLSKEWTAWREDGKSPVESFRELLPSSGSGGGTGESGISGLWSPPPPPREEELTLEQRRAMAAWGEGDKRRYVEHSTALAARIEERSSGGYSYGSSALSKARSALQALDGAIDRDDWLRAPDRLAEAQEAVRLFEAGCRWTPGSRHTRYAHIHASSREGVWNADDGWTFVRKNSLEVLQICPECDGSGKEDGWVTCPGCNGEGEVETTLSGFTSFIDDLANGIEAVDNFNRALHGKSPHGSGGHSHSRQYVTCNTCNGRGEVAQQRRCSRCGGRGTLR